MEKAIRKMYFSMLTAILVLITTITTTYAWFGIDFGHTIESFELTFDSSTSEGLELSLDGVNFSSFISTREVQQAVLTQKGISYNSFNVEEKFQEVASMSATTARVSGSNINFYDMENQPDNDNYLSFTFYVRPSYIVGPEDIPEDGIYHAGHTIDVYFKDNTIVSGNNIKAYLINPFTHPVMGTISQAYVNPANATRFALRKYECIDYDATYSGSETSVLTIYNPGGNAFSHNITTNYHNFGGILSDEYNCAVHDYNSKFGTSLTVPDYYINREDVDLDTNKIIDSETDGLNIEKVMKFDFYFWYEGWDADCFEDVVKASCSINLDFTTQNPKNN